MNLIIKDMWIEALLSGDYPQTKLCLHDEGGYCCLGVLTDLYIKEHFPDEEWRDMQDLNRIFGRVVSKDFLPIGILPKEVMEWSGIDTPKADLPKRPIHRYEKNLAAINDAGHSFSDIASIIDENF